MTTELTTPLIITAAVIVTGAVLQFLRVRRKAARRHDPPWLERVNRKKDPLASLPREQAARDARRLSPATFMLEKVSLILIIVSMAGNAMAQPWDYELPRLSREEVRGQKSEVRSPDLPPSAFRLPPSWQSAPSRFFTAAGAQEPGFAWTLIGLALFAHLALTFAAASIARRWGYEHGEHMGFNTGYDCALRDARRAKAESPFRVAEPGRSAAAGGFGVPADMVPEESEARS